MVKPAGSVRTGSSGHISEDVLDDASASERPQMLGNLAWFFLALVIGISAA
jgi:hypothetical protein